MRSQDIPWRARARVLVSWLVMAGLSVVTLVAPLPFSGQVTLQVGDVATADVISPRQITYVSQLLTEQRRELAANAVQDVYDGRQTRIGRQQLTLVNRILDFIGTVRSDSYADMSTKTTYLRAIAGLDLSPEVITRTLTLSTPAWDRVATETQSVLERSMREEIRENTLADERRKVPARVRLDMTDEDASIVSTVVQALLVPNSFYNAERTEQQRQQARDQVEPVTATLERNETIIRAGDIITPLDIEALEVLGLQQTGWSWEDVRSASGFVLLLIFLLLYYLWRQEPELWLQPTQSLLLPLILWVFLFAAKAAVPTHALLPYLFPYAALTLLLSLLVNLRVALVTTGLFMLAIGWLSGGSLEFMTYASAAALVGALKLRRGDRLANFAWVSAFVIGVNLLVVTAFRLAAGGGDLRVWVELVAAAVINGLVTITVTLVGIYLVGAIFGVITPLHLMELSRPTHPLLRQLLLKAPGTYHHTLIVSNMVERAAEVIGADAMLARVGAYYHDVGKTIRPYFFTENQSEGMNPHARLDPFTSAQIIITHVKDGMDLARKYRLPQPVIDFIPEHQGTLLVSYFYHQAVEQAGSPDEVDPAQFRYPGPKPRSPETAITMLADAAEATVRSKHPESVEEMERIVTESLKSRMASGELDECPLTLADVQAIRQVFVDVLRGLHHPRIAYPAEAAAQEAAPAVPTAPVATDAAPAAAAPKEENTRVREFPNNDAGVAQTV